MRQATATITESERTRGAVCEIDQRIVLKPPDIVRRAFAPPSSLRVRSAHYHHERNHQGIGNRLIASNLNRRATGSVSRRERLGGMLNYYYRAAA